MIGLMAVQSKVVSSWRVRRGVLSAVMDKEEEDRQRA